MNGCEVGGVGSFVDPPATKLHHPHRVAALTFSVTSDRFIDKEGKSHWQLTHQARRIRRLRREIWQTPVASDVLHWYKFPTWQVFSVPNKDNPPMRLQPLHLSFILYAVENNHSTRLDSLEATTLPWGHNSGGHTLPWLPIQPLFAY